MPEEAMSEEVKAEDIRVEYVDFEEVKRWPRNPKDHDLHEIRKSFHRFGFIKPVLIDEGTGQLVAGHGRLDTLRLMQRNEVEPPRGVKVSGSSWLVPVLRGVAFKDEQEAEAFLLADNRLSEIGGWNKDLLAEILGEMQEIDGMIDGTGFGIDDVMKLVGGYEDEGNAPTLKEEFLIVITCKDEDKQSELIEEFLGRGLDCKALMA